MAPRRGLISYDGLPVSSGGSHGLGRIGPRAAFDAVERFLGTCTKTTAPRRATITVRFEDHTQPALIAALHASAASQLGVRLADVNQNTYGGTMVQDWPVSTKRAADTLEWLAGAKGLPKTPQGDAASVTLDYHVRLKAMKGGAELGFQKPDCYLRQAYDGYGVTLGRSGCRIVLGESRSSMSTILFLPFEEPGPELWQYARFLQTHLPFKFSHKHWKHWRLTKKGNSYVGRRIDASGLSAKRVERKS
jgi:hypothetical protein